MKSLLLALWLSITTWDIQPVPLPQVPSVDISHVTATKKLDAWVKAKAGRVACVSYAWGAGGTMARVVLIEVDGDKEPAELTVDAATLDEATTKALNAWGKIH